MPNIDLSLISASCMMGLVIAFIVIGMLLTDIYEGRDK